MGQLRGAYDASDLDIIWVHFFKLMKMAFTAMVRESQKINAAL